MDAATQQAAEDEAPKKKPRLGWGQGLAKYAKRQTPGCADPAKPSADGSPDGVEQKVDVGAGVPASAPLAPSSAPPYSSPGMQAILTLFSLVSNQLLPPI